MFNIKYIFAVLFVALGVSTSQYVLFENYNSHTCSGSPASGRYYSENTCIRGYIYSCVGNSVQAQRYYDAECERIQGSPIFNEINQCLTSEHSFYNESAFIATCVDSYDIPENTVIHVDYTGDCNTPAWKNNVVDMEYKYIGACQAYPDGGVQFSCNSTDLIMNTFESAFDYTCSGSYSTSTIPMSKLNNCANVFNPFNEMNICNSN